MAIVVLIGTPLVAKRMFAFVVEAAVIVLDMVATV
jgi:hypothetical protein